jgi:hypothetical protein
MINLLGKEKVGDKIAFVKNVFSQNFVSFLYEDCQRQLKVNTNNEVVSNFLDDVDIAISKCIIDCHGLRICDDLVRNDLIFPYSIKNWNIFCLKMQNIMFEYCDEFGLDKSQLTPHSSWVERSSVSKYKFREKQINRLDDTDEFLNTWLNVNDIRHYRILYFLKNPDPKVCGLSVGNGKSILTLPAEENSLYIVPTSEGEYYSQYSMKTEDNIILMFDWYLHPKGSKYLPAWKFPNKYNYQVFRNYVEDATKNRFFSDDHQKILYKHYLKMFKKQLEKTLASRK